MKHFTLLMIGLLMSAVAHAGLFSTAGKDDDCTESRSLAWCVLDFVRMSEGLRDTAAPNGAGAAAPAPGEVRKTADGIKTAVGVGIAAADALKLGTPLPGMSSGGSAAMFLFSALVGSSQNTADRNWSATLIPANTTAIADKGAALAVARESLIKAVTSLLGATGGEMVDGAPPSVPEAKYIKTYYRFTGGECEQRTCVLLSHLVSSRQGLLERKAPAWLGSGTVYASPAGDSPFVRVDGKAPQEAFFIALSEQMPDWYYLYLPPNTARSYPVVLNKGQALHFVKPSRAASEGIASLIPQ